MLCPFIYSPNKFFLCPQTPQVRHETLVCYTRHNYPSEEIPIERRSNKDRWSLSKDIITSVPKPGIAKPHPGTSSDVVETQELQGVAKDAPSTSRAKTIVASVLHKAANQGADAQVTDFARFIHQAFPAFVSQILTTDHLFSRLQNIILQPVNCRLCVFIVIVQAGTPMGCALKQHNAKCILVANQFKMAILEENVRFARKIVGDFPQLSTNVYKDGVSVHLHTPVYQTPQHEGVHTLYSNQTFRKCSVFSHSNCKCN